MNLIFFTHPSFLPSQSMPRFANMLINGMSERGHNIDVWTPDSKYYQLPAPSASKKWLGYIDQYIVFPQAIKNKLKVVSRDTIFIFTDHALGPWIPLVKNFPHIIHCHDFLAQRSAMGKIPENQTGWSGRQYQAYIRKGYQQGKNFISVSQKTREDLHLFLHGTPAISEVVYNGMNQHVKRTNISVARKKLSGEININLEQGYLLHVGGNQWYKNRNGVIAIYNAWRKISNRHLPLLMIGSAPSALLKSAKNGSPYHQDIYFLTGINDASVQLAYLGATAFLYPSLAEGFGWPIAEAMAAGCPVITTGEAPMNEVGGKAATYIARQPYKENQLEWANECAGVVEQIINLNVEKRETLLQAGFDNIQRFDTAVALDKIESFYQQVLLNHHS